MQDANSNVVGFLSNTQRIIKEMIFSTSKILNITNSFFANLQEQIIHDWYSHTKFQTYSST